MTDDGEDCKQELASRMYGTDSFREALREIGYGWAEPQLTDQQIRAMDLSCATTAFLRSMDVTAVRSIYLGAFFAGFKAASASAAQPDPVGGS